MGTKFKETKVGRIPDDWDVVRLGDVCRKITDGTHKTPAYTDQGIPFLSTTNIMPFRKGFDFSQYCKYISHSEHLELTKRCKPEKGDLLVSKCGTIGRLKLVDVDFEFSIFVGLALLKINNEIVSGEYLEQLLNYEPLQHALEIMAPGSTRQTLTINCISKVLIPLPSPPEQRKIAEILSTVDEAIEKTDAIIRETQQLKRGLMQKLFTEGIEHTRFKETKIGRIPEEWECRRIGDFVIGFKGGASLTPSDFTTRGKKVLPKVGVVPGGILRIPVDKQQYCSEEYAEANHKSVVDSQFIIVVLRDLVPSGPSIGLMVRIPNGEEYLLAQGVYGLRINRERLDETFIIQLSNSNWYRKYMQRILVGSTQVHIRNSEFRNVLIPYPSIEEQRGISQILIEVAAQIENYLAYKVELEQLKKGLMQILLTGKMRVKTDEER